MICHHLGYQVKMEISHVKLIGWVSKNLNNKYMHWRSQLWSFHVQLEVEIVQPWIDMVVYFIDKTRITLGSMNVKTN